MINSFNKNNLLNWFGVIPENWNIKKLKFIATEIKEKRKPINGDIKISPENVESYTGRIINFYSDYDTEGQIFQIGDILFNMRVVIDEITMFLTNLGTLTPHLALKAFLNAIKYDEYKILYWIIIIALIIYIMWLIFYEDRKSK